jgi:hypothetical protein
MPYGKEDMMPFMPRNWNGKDDLMQINFYMPLNKNDVFSLSIKLCTFCINVPNGPHIPN